MIAGLVHPAVLLSGTLQINSDVKWTIQLTHLQNLSPESLLAAAELKQKQQQHWILELAGASVQHCCSVLHCGCTSTPAGSGDGF
jgi:hypothetical protein